MFPLDDLGFARDFARQVRHRLGERLKRASLFGSRARRDHRFRSDYDLLFVVSDATGEVRSTIHGEASAVELASNVDLSTKILSEADFTRLLTTSEPFWKNFRRDEMLLWPTSSTPVATGRLPQQLASTLRELKDERESADYSVYPAITQADATRAVAAASRFVDALAEFVRSQGFEAE